MERFFTSFPLAKTAYFRKTSEYQKWDVGQVQQVKCGPKTVLLSSFFKTTEDKKFDINIFRKCFFQIINIAESKNMDLSIPYFWNYLDQTEQLKIATIIREGLIGYKATLNIHDTTQTKSLKI